jgi:hypothetical protein
MSLVGKVMVFKGGSFSGHKRDFAAALAMAQLGVKLETSVTRATHILVCGSGVGAKTIEDAKKKGIQVWTANDFWENYQKPQYCATEKPSVKEQAPGNDAAGSGASGRGRKQKATAEGVEKPAKKAAKKDEDGDPYLSPLSDEAAARIEKRASSMTVEEMIYGVKNTRPVV